MGVIFILSICAGSLAQGLTAMEQPTITKNIFINPNRGGQARTLEKLATITLGYHGFVLEMLKTKQAFAGTEASLENKLNLAVQSFIDAKNTKEFAEFLELCGVYQLPIQNGALERARKFMQQKITEETEKSRAQFEESLGIIGKFQGMVQKIDISQRKSSSVIPIEKPKQLFDMIYGSSPTNGLYPLLQQPQPQSSDNPFTSMPKSDS